MRLIRGLTAALNGSNRFHFKPPEYSVDFLVVGGGEVSVVGVIGLAIANRLCKLFPRKSTYVVERNSLVGEETSSRNSEVIHAGIYYPPNSLKATLCIRGRQLLYEHCLEHGVHYNNLGKLIVAGKGQRSYLENIISQINSLPPEQRPPLELIHGAQAREMEPDLSTKIDSALHSPQTGIIDSHELIKSLEKEITNSEGGDIVYSTRVVRVDPYRVGSSGGWIVQTLTTQRDAREPSETDAILAGVLINASGLNAHLILNSLLSPESVIPMYYARGSYVSYRGPGTKSISRLVYPVPELTRDVPGESHLFDFQSLGVHLTLDIKGNIRFGPDIEWLTPPFLTMNTDFETDEKAIDFWKQHLHADEQQQRLEGMHRAITQYLPNITLSGLRPDYVGIRPKLGPPTNAFRDFEIRVDSSSVFGGSGEAPMITSLGIESPGLTASLAIAELVVNRLKQWKIGS